MNVLSDPKEKHAGWPDCLQCSTLQCTLVWAEGRPTAKRWQNRQVPSWWGKFTCEVGNDVRLFSPLVWTGQQRANSHGVAIHVMRVVAFQSVFLRVKDHMQLYYVHIMQLQVGTSFEEILNKCKVLTNENWYGERVDINIGTPGMCPCPIISSLLGQQLITFEVTPWLVSHLFCPLFPFDWQQFKATPCLVSHLPCLLQFLWIGNPLRQRRGVSVIYMLPLSRQKFEETHKLSMICIASFLLLFGWMMHHLLSKATAKGNIWA